jgi:hypothetical protein
MSNFLYGVEISTCKEGHMVTPLMMSEREMNNFMATNHPLCQGAKALVGGVSVYRDMRNNDLLLISSEADAVVLEFNHFLCAITHTNEFVNDLLSKLLQ